MTFIAVTHRRCDIIDFLRTVIHMNQGVASHLLSSSICIMFFGVKNTIAGLCLYILYCISKVMS